MSDNSLAQLFQGILQSSLEGTRALMPADRFIERLHAPNQIRHVLPWIRSARLGTEVRAAPEGPVSIDRAAAIHPQHRTSVLRMCH